MLESENTIVIVCADPDVVTSKDMSLKSACSLSGVYTCSHTIPMSRAEAGKSRIRHT